MGRPYPAPVWRVALWLMLMGAVPGRCAWDSLSERYDGFGSDDAHSNGKENERTVLERCKSQSGPGRT